MKKTIVVAGVQFVLEEDAWEGGQSRLCVARVAESDISRPILIKQMKRDPEATQQLIESERLAQMVAQQSHQYGFASIFYDAAQEVSVMLRASADCKPLSTVLDEWEVQEDGALTRILDATAIVKSILHALLVQHQAGVLHLDLSPGNILVAGDANYVTAYLIDMHSCRKTGTLTDGTIRSSASFAAPELRQNGLPLTDATDLYSVGAILLLLVAGKQATRAGKYGSDWTLPPLPGLRNRSITRYIDALEIPNAYKPQLANILISATTRSGLHYSSAAEMLDAIEKLEADIHCQGMTATTIFRGSESYYAKESKTGSFNYEIDPDIVPQIVHGTSKEPIDILKENTILLGEGGSGKSTVVWQLYQKCLQKWQGHPGNPIPIYVPLATFNGSKDAYDCFIHDYISGNYFQGLSMAVSERRMNLDKLLSSGQRFVVFLDGINEAVDSYMLREEIMTLANMSNVSVCITSRSELQDAWSNLNDRFQVAHLTPIGDDVILKKLNEKNRKTPSDRLMETLRRPMFLSLYLQMKGSQIRIETAGEILSAYHKHLKDAYVRSCHRREWQMVQQLSLDVLLPGLAANIGKMVFDRSKARQILRKLKLQKQDDDDFADAEAFLNSRGKLLDAVAMEFYCNCGILNKLRGNQYRFSHQFYLEFYNAWYIQEQMTSNVDACVELLGRQMLPASTLRFLGDLLGEYQWERKKQSPSPIEQWLQDNARGECGEQVQITIKNLVEAMKLARHSLISADYSGLDLSMVSFQNCDLRDSKFEGAMLSDATLQRVGHHDSADHLAFVPGKPWIITSCRGEKEINIWNYKLGVFVGRLNCEKNAIDFDISPNGEYLAVKERSGCTCFVEIFRLSDRKMIQKIDFGWWNVFSLKAEKIRTKDILYTAQSFWQGVAQFGADSETLICSFGPDGEDDVYIWHFLDAHNSHYQEVFDIRDAYSSMSDPTVQSELSFDRKTLFCVSEHGCVAALNLETGAWTKCGPMPTCTGSITSTRDGRALMFVDANDRLCSYDLDTHEVQQLCRDVVGSPIAANDFLMWTQGSYLMGWNIVQKVKEMHAIWDINGLCVDSSGEVVALSRSHGRVQICDLEEKRLIFEFFCGVGEGYGQVGETKIVHWSKNGIVRQRHCDQAHCLSQDGGRVVSFPRSYFNLFDGQYTISVEVCDNISNVNVCTTSSGQKFLSYDEQIVVRTIDTGEVVALAPWTPLCVARDKTGQTIFQERSGIQWARYLPDHKKLIVGMNLACVRIWADETKNWVQIENWDEQIRKIIQLPDTKKPEGIGRKAWDLSYSCAVMGKYIITGTVDGHILFWNFAGELVKDVHAHDSMPERVFRIPMSNLFMTMTNGEYCIWNFETAELVDVGAKPTYVTEGNVIGAVKYETWPIEPHSVEYLEREDANLTIIAERFRNTVLIGVGYHEIGDAGIGWMWEMIARSKDSKKVAYRIGNCIEVYSIETGKCISSIELVKQNLAKVSDVQFSPDGNGLAVAYKDGRVLLVDLREEIIKLWDVVSPSNLTNCDFSGAIMSARTKKLLSENGAIVDKP